jgi:hypothetical protein
VFLEREAPLEFACAAWEWTGVRSRDSTILGGLAVTVTVVVGGKARR